MPASAIPNERSQQRHSRCESESRCATPPCVDVGERDAIARFIAKMRSESTFGKFESEITLCCKSLKTQGKFRGWVLGTEFATGSCPLPESQRPPTDRTAVSCCSIVVNRLSEVCIQVSDSRIHAIERVAGCCLSGLFSGQAAPRSPIRERGSGRAMAWTSSASRRPLSCSATAGRGGNRSEPHARDIPLRRCPK